MNVDAASRYYFDGEFKLALNALWKCHADALAARDRDGVEMTIALAREIAKRDPASKSECTRLIRVAGKSLRSLGGPTGDEQELADSRTLTARVDAIKTTARSRDRMPSSTFEYDVVDLARDDVAAYLERAGSLGWELVAVTNREHDGLQRLFLKRIVSGPSERGPSSTPKAWGGVGIAFDAGES